MEDEKVEELDNLRHCHGAYLCARATGRPPRRRDAEGFPSYGEQYAAALGVHHFFRGTRPISALDLRDRLGEACDLPEEEEDAEQEPLGLGDVVRLSRALSELFPGETGRTGEATVDTAIRVLRSSAQEALSLREELAGARELAQNAVSLVREGVLREREACAAYLRKWPNGHSAVLANHLADGKHIVPECDPRPQH